MLIWSASYRMCCTSTQTTRHKQQRAEKNALATVLNVRSHCLHGARIKRGKYINCHRNIELDRCEREEFNTFLCNSFKLKMFCNSIFISVFRCVARAHCFILDYLLKTAVRCCVLFFCISVNNLFHWIMARLAVVMRFFIACVRIMLHRVHAIFHFDFTLGCNEIENRSIFSLKSFLSPNLWNAWFPPILHHLALRAAAYSPLDRMSTILMHCL